MSGKVNPQCQSCCVEYFRKDASTQYSQRRDIEIEINKIKQMQLQKLFESFRYIQSIYILFEHLFGNFSKNLVFVMSVRQIKEVQANRNFTHNQSHYYILMDFEQIQTTPVKKRFCCGAAKRLKEKCLNFHKSEQKCIDFIRGHEECIVVKRRFEGRQELPQNPLSK